MAVKFILTGSLRLDVQPPGAAVQNITLPIGLTIKFSISRKALASTQTGQFRIYGLSSRQRDQIFKDRFDWTVFRKIQFSAGYGGNIPEIFNGTILQAYSEREGTTDTVTVIEAFDGGFQMTNGIIADTIPAGERYDTVIAKLGSVGGGYLNGVTADPVVGSFPTKNQRPEVILGNTWGILQDKAGGNATIDNGQVKALNPNEAMATPRIPLVSSATGLIGVPRRSGAMVEFDMVFEPNMVLFGLVNLQSTFNTNFNGTHKVYGFEHRGAISLTEAVPNITTGTFVWFPNAVAASDLKSILTSAGA